MSHSLSRSTGYFSEAREIMRLGWPAIGAQLAQMSMGVVDTVMAGQLGPEALASVSIGGSIWMPLVCTCMGILLSVSPCVSQSFGAGQYNECGRHARQGLWIGVALSALGIVIVQWAAEFMALFKVDPSLIPVASAYLQAVCFGLPGLMSFVVLRGFCEGVSSTRPILIISILATFFNMFANYTLMYGHFGFPRLGAPGLGVATAATNYLMALGLALWIYFFSDYRRYELFRRFELPNWPVVWHLIHVGVPIAVSLFMEVTCFAFAGLLMGRLGADVVSGHQIALNLASVTFMVPLGVSTAVSVRVGQFIGAKEPGHARRSGSVGSVLCAGFMTISACGFALFPRAIVGLYTHDEGVQAVGGQLLLLAAIFQLFDGLQVAAAGALRGLKDTRVTMFITLFAYWVLGLPLGIWLGLYRGWGAPGFWISFSVALGFAALLLTLRFQFSMARRATMALAADSQAD